MNQPGFSCFKMIMNLNSLVLTYVAMLFWARYLAQTVFSVYIYRCKCAHFFFQVTYFYLILKN